MKYIMYILVFVSFVFSQQFTRNSSNEVVKEYASNLMWIDNKSVLEEQMNHKDALLYCKELRHSGYRNWRLPMIVEFETIVDKKNKKTKIKKIFKFNMPNGYWAYKAHIRTLWYYADYMNFISGTAYFDNRNVNKYVRCVRDIK